MDYVYVNGYNVPLMNTDFVMNSNFSFPPNMNLNDVHDFEKPVHVTNMDVLPSEKKIQGEGFKHSRKIDYGATLGGAVTYRKITNKNNIKFVI